MASTSKTPCLNLNQWSPDDPVLREDFNADNAAIDTAFSAVRLKAVYAEEAVSLLSADLTDLPLEKFAALHILFVLPGDSTQSALNASSYYGMLFNGIIGSESYSTFRYGASSWNNSEYVSLGSISQYSGEWGASDVTLFLNSGILRGRLNTIPAADNPWAGGFRVKYNGPTGETLTSVDLIVNRSNYGRLLVPAGAGIIVYGFRK